MTSATTHTPGCVPDEFVWLTATDRNRRLSGALFHYIKCRRCEVVRLENVPADLGRYYPTEYYELPSARQLERIAAADASKITLVRRFVTGGRLLEIGPAQGVFAFQARKAGFDVDVIEMDARCCEHLARVVGVNAVCSDAPQDVIPGSGPYQVIALWHVIEHLVNPWTLLDAAARALAPGGILVIAAPNPAAWQFRVMGAEWPHLDAPRHLYLLPVSVVSTYLAGNQLARVYCTSGDSDAKRWNRFGWQRLLMNRMPGRWTQRGGFLAGLALSAVMAPFEAGELKGSTYTMVFQRA